MLTQDQVEFLEQALPPIIARVEIQRYAPGLISASRLANLESQGKGPRTIKLGRKAGYTRKDFIDWISTRSGPK